MKRIWTKYKELIILIATVVILGLAAAGIQQCREMKKLENRVAAKIEEIATPPVTIQHYDSATANRLIRIEVDRKMAHMAVDTLHDRQLQSALDSVFNHHRR